jgi:hypothetical protein
MPPSVCKSTSSRADSVSFPALVASGRFIGAATARTRSSRMPRLMRL